MPYFDFRPDLVIECTRLCDRGCKGCYAPNVIRRVDKSTTADSRSGLHLSPADLANALAELDTIGASFPISVAVRGGEPSLHPDLAALLSILGERARPVYVETHGRWIGVRDEFLLEACVERGVILKISFDAMHLIPVTELRRICDVADDYGAPWLVAITEATEADLQKTRRLCDWIPDERIVLQHKANHFSQLIQPRLGVLKPRGALESTLSVRPELVR